MMKRKHTKKQIVEAIRYWYRQLKKIDESVYNNVIDALIAEFKEDRVKSKTFDYNLTQDDLEKIFKILNKHLFNGQIKKVPVRLWPENKLVDKLNYHLAESGIFNQQYKEAPCYGVHSAICVDILDSNQAIVDVKVRDDIIMMNNSRILNSIFIFVVACICHEMIHLYDRQMFDEYHALALMQSQTGKDQNFHNTQIFKEKMKEANANGINVVPKFPKDKSHNQVNIDARYVLSQVVGESDDESIVVKNDQMVFVKNKKTGIGVLTHFD